MGVKLEVQIHSIRNLDLGDPGKIIQDKSNNKNSSRSIHVRVLGEYNPNKSLKYGSNASVCSRLSALSSPSSSSSLVRKRALHFRATGVSSSAAVECDATGIITRTNKKVSWSSEPYSNRSISWEISHGEYEAMVSRNTGSHNCGKVKLNIFPVVNNNNGMSEQDNGLLDDNQNELKSLLMKKSSNALGWALVDLRDVNKEQNEMTFTTSPASDELGCEIRFSSPRSTKCSEEIMNHQTVKVYGCGPRCEMDVKLCVSQLAKEGTLLAQNLQSPPGAAGVAPPTSQFFSPASIAVHRGGDDNYDDDEVSALSFDTHTNTFVKQQTMRRHQLKVVQDIIAEHDEKESETSNADVAEAISPPPPPPPPSIKTSTSPNGTALQIGLGRDYFSLTIKLKCAYNLHMLDDGIPILGKEGAWLSYSCFGIIVQTNRFHSLKHPEFDQVTDSFRIRSSPSELKMYLQSLPPLFVHVCAGGAILGSAGISLSFIVSSINFKRGETRGYFNLHNNGKVSDEIPLGSCEPCIGLAMVLERQAQKQAVTESHQTKISSANEPQTVVPHQMTPPKIKNNVNTTNVSPEKIQGKSLSADFDNEPKGASAHDANDLTFEKRRLEWEEWRHTEEIKWHEQLRSKEAAAIRILEDRAKEKEKELVQAMNANQLEYGRLEQRLKKSLGDIESKERKLNAEDMKRQADYALKISDLQLQQRRAKDEANHIVELEKSKHAAALERASIAEKTAKAAVNRAKALEEELDELRCKQRQYPEAVLQQEVIVLKGKLADYDAKVMKERSEKNQALVEKERLKAKANQLARALKREKDKTAAQARQEVENLRLEYVAQEQRHILDGDRNTLQQIKAELIALNRAGMEISSSPGRCNPFSPKRTRSSAPETGHLRNIEPNVPQSPAEEQDAPVDAELLRLRRERDELLAIGVYNHEHKIIKQLDQLIAAREAIH
mmetsp:Transcript_7056/g.10554  ORF Transcript_7056/g.10554 Transcript_7056/m.10554 type:complete len:949 (-) Transcript_7056:20-2866(-)